MRIIILFSILLIGYSAFAQDKLVKITGTKCSLIPPAGFIVATNFSGFQQVEKGASIMINQLPVGYQSIVNDFTAEALKAKGMTLVSKEIIDFNNSKATLINLTQPANGTTYNKLILVFGDTKETVLVNGIYPESYKNIEEKIKTALLSTIYDASQNEDPLHAASFTIDATGTDFKIIKYMSGSLLYSTDGKIPTVKPTLIVGNSLAAIPTQNQKEYSVERLKKLPGGELSVIKEITAVTIDNLSGFEIIADGKSKDNKAELIYQVMLFNSKGDYYIIVGRAKEEFEKNLAAFKKISATFKRK